ncbi:MAG: phosphatidylglycerophosphate synthase [Actinobacteria bacterium]|nr:phosphatidylglycerophosphate synthase [Actinomycetota bacterium]
MLDGNLRTAVDRALIPIGRVLQRIGITADVVTVIGIAMSGAAAVAIGRGNLLLGFILLILTGIPDALDGAVAKAAGTSSKRGAFFDSVSDRLTDALLFGGLTWHYVTTRPGHLVMLPVAVMASAQIISYQRAKAELLGYEAKGGVMERAERFIVLALGLLLSVIIGDDALLVVLWIMLALTLVTAIQRFIKVWIQATAEQKNEI